MYKDTPALNKNKTDKQVLAAVDAWKHVYFNAKTTSSMDWTTHFTMYIVQSRTIIESILAKVRTSALKAVTLRGSRQMLRM